MMSSRSGSKTALVLEVLYRVMLEKQPRYCVRAGAIRARCRCMRRILLLSVILSACATTPLAVDDNAGGGTYTATPYTATTTSTTYPVPTVPIAPSVSYDDVAEAAATRRVTAPAVDQGTRIVAVGDVACAIPSTCRHVEVAALVARLDPAAFVVLGDVQYPSGLLKDFLASYDVSFGSWMPVVYPTPGNHEMQSNRAGYDEYFRPLEDRVVVHRSEDAVWYSFDVGGWHFVSVDSNHPKDAEQLAWLAEDLRASQARCSAVFWHHPRFSSGQHGSSASVASLWETAVNGGADIVLAGHDHNYERFAPLTASGDRAVDGVVEFVVGTGGKSLRGAGKRALESEIFLSSTDGVLELTLWAEKADFRFVSTADETLDAGSLVCD